ncbi:hypothetical protein [Frigoriflavimonas asaccharolytica]|uniref:Outer membrane protein with beta-barrel domain n=1 Tax=Frigoriflavimonas asaccharolytica TaxID=2735899 RepID=A0A8J8K832_9FLAO|nr:hypothetical protein [Frigoriflavimonas asaccharolytica]NRS92583.1 hypothetical protein [Frigoriflavimonas asaccharolytica]
MKNFKTAIFGLAILATGFATAQETSSVSMKNMLKVGISGGASVPSENASANLGVDLAYQNLVTPSFGLGIATGYSHFFGQENNGLDNNDFGVVPVAALFRYYPKNSGVFFGTDLGYGFIVGDDKVASNSVVNRPDGGLYLKPEIGYHNRDWNFTLHYQKTFTSDEGQIGTQDYNAGALGLGIGYNIPLGK